LNQNWLADEDLFQGDKNKSILTDQLWKAFKSRKAARNNMCFKLRQEFLKNLDKEKGALNRNHTKEKKCAVCNEPRPSDEVQDP
jgi:hypothetical protein